MTDLDAVALARRLTTRTPGGIAEQIQHLIDDGTLAPGTRLPTVRDIAQEISVSVGTIAQAWSILREENAVETRRRGGTRVVDSTSRSRGGFRGFAHIDLLFGSPDPTLLPPLEDAFATALKHPTINMWSREYITDALRDAALTELPFTPEAIIAAGGGTEALWLAIRASSQPGDTLAVETPASPGFLDTARSMGLTLTEVETDAAGPVPYSLQKAVEAGAVAFVYSPSGAFSKRHLLTEERAGELGAVVQRTDIILIEDDPLGPLAENPGATMGKLFPERTVRARAYCRAFGVDLRTAVLAGPQHLIDRAITLRAGGLTSTSRILQQTLASLITDPAIRRRVAHARRSYALRKAKALEALSLAELSACSGPSSWSIWVQVPDERQAALSLSGQGVTADLGSSAQLTPPRQEHLRISIAQLPDDGSHLGELARLISKAAAGTLRQAPV